MGHEGKVIGLYSLAARIDAARIALMGDKPKPGDAAFVQMERQIDGWQRQVQGILKQLNSKSSFNHMIYHQNRFGAHAYAAKQRLHSQEANVGAQLDALKLVNLMLAKLARDLYAGPSDDQAIMDAFAQALDNWQTKDKTTKDMAEALQSIDLRPAEVQETFREVQVKAGPVPLDPGNKHMPTAPGLDSVMIMMLTLFVLIKKALSDKA